MANDNWETPEWLISHARALFGEFALDTAATASNTKAPKFYGLGPAVGDCLGNGLVMPWNLKWWCNPPYSNVKPWVGRARYAEVPGVMLLPNDPTVTWWKDHVAGEAIVFPVDRRIAFVGAGQGGRGSHVLAIYGWRASRLTIPTPPRRPR